MFRVGGNSYIVLLDRLVIILRGVSSVAGEVGVGDDLVYVLNLLIAFRDLFVLVEQFFAFGLISSALGAAAPGRRPGGDCRLGFFERQALAVPRQKDNINRNFPPGFYISFGVRLCSRRTHRDDVCSYKRKTGKNPFAFFIALGVVLSGEVGAKNVDHGSPNWSRLAISAD